MFRKLIQLILLHLFLSSCSLEDNLERDGAQPSVTLIDLGDGEPVDSQNLTFVIKNNQYENVTEYSLNGEYAAIVNIEGGFFQIQVVTNEGVIFSKRALLSDTIYFNPIVSKSGVLAYLLHSGINSKSEIYYDGEKIPLKIEGLYKELRISEHFLISQVVVAGGDFNYLYVLDRNYT